MSDCVAGASYSTTAPKAGGTSLPLRPRKRCPVGVSGIKKPSAFWGSFWTESFVGLKAHSDFHGSSLLALSRPRCGTNPSPRVPENLTLELRDEACSCLIISAYIALTSFVRPYN
eukprot:7862043-Pyramimonas_sp.AAC.1